MAVCGQRQSDSLLVVLYGCTHPRGSTPFLALFEMCTSDTALHVFLSSSIKQADIAEAAVYCGLIEFQIFQTRV